MKRGFWAIHGEDFVTGIRRTEGLENRGGSVYLAGLLGLDSAEQVADELLRSRTGVHSVMIMGLDASSEPSLLNGILGSPNLSLREFFIRFILPETIAAVVAGGSLVLRLWREDQTVLEAYGDPEVLRRIPGIS